MESVDQLISADTCTSRPGIAYVVIYTVVYVYVGVVCVVYIRIAISCEPGNAIK